MWVLLILVIVVVLWMVAAYNGLISLKNQTVNAFLLGKLESAPDLFTDEQLKRFDYGYERTPISRAVSVIRAKRLNAVADRLLDNPKE